MIVNVRLFALTREITGKTSFTQTIADGSTVNDFSNWLFAEYPLLKNLGLQFAVNMAYAPLDSVLHEADEIACIPPVGGG